MVNFRDKKEFVDYIDSQPSHPDADVYLIVVCQCGKEYVFNTKADIPESNLVCPCKRSVILYG